MVNNLPSFPFLMDFCGFVWKWLCREGAGCALAGLCRVWPRSPDTWELGTVTLRMAFVHFLSSYLRAGNASLLFCTVCHREGSSRVSFTLQGHVWLFISLSRSRCKPLPRRRSAGTWGHGRAQQRFSLRHHPEIAANQFCNNFNKLIQFGEPRKRKERD